MKEENTENLTNNELTIDELQEKLKTALDTIKQHYYENKIFIVTKGSLGVTSKDVKNFCESENQSFLFTSHQVFRLFKKETDALNCKIEYLKEKEIDPSIRIEMYDFPVPCCFGIITTLNLSGDSTEEKDEDKKE